MTVTSAATKSGRRARAIGAWALALGLLAPWRSTTFAAGDGTIPPIYHKERSFRIPFDLGGKDYSRIKELQLWASEDAGFNWYSVSKTTPDQKVFTFRARRDGEYWFAVRTISMTGQASPATEETIKPALRVIVDTVPPTLVLESNGRQGSVAKVRWEAKDENLELKSLTLEYQLPGARDWKRIPVRRPALLGTESWNANTVESIRVRGSVVDKAGNPFETEVDLPEGASAPPDMATLDPEAGSAPPVEPFRRGRSPIEADSSFTPVEDDPATSPAPRSGSAGWGGGGSRRPIAKQARAGSESLLSSSPPAPNWDAATGTAATPTPAPVPASNLGADPAPARPPGFPDPFPNSGGGVAGASPGGGPAATGGEAGAATMLVGNPRFRLKYEVQDPGPGGRAALVELWMTRDGGRTWIRRGEDPDRTSPIDVDLGGEGTYGVSLVARSSSGLGDQPPSPNDVPQTWVEVDSTPPRVHLYNPEIGTGVHAGKVAISWRAEDLHLAPKPVSICWRPDQPGAAWVPVEQAQGQQAAGQFVWAVPPNFPPKFHVRVEAVDAAGNRGGTETTDANPVIVDRSRPKSRIIGLDSDSRSGEGPSAHISR
ncbi:hypothetical protein [Paludisphaera mucosa]|uniref:Ser-Thr-rich glycosyl-phosphatidyl-inositol-anchored membrane family protein n=1 Tax=Paludisphaera mucosa TaxID=3030827 RepID=A0ABT6FH17_9BACT|nr:hypothetical protein [Paludisphaera mucosa]MDG3006876.1 hypothetical protein [Paludisphaera mucosa]